LTGGQDNNGQAGAEVVLNLTDYSHTTTTHQQGLRVLLRMGRGCGIGRVLEVGSLPFKVEPTDLADIAYARTTPWQLRHPGRRFRPLVAPFSW
jgi:hypothetical protein